MLNFMLDNQYEAGPWTYPKSLFSKEVNVNTGDVRYIKIKEHGIDDFYKAKKTSEFSDRVFWEPVTKPSDAVVKKTKRQKISPKKIEGCY